MIDKIILTHELLKKLSTLISQDSTILLRNYHHTLNLIQLFSYLFCKLYSYGTIIEELSTNKLYVILETDEIKPRYVSLIPDLVNHINSSFCIIPHKTFLKYNGNIHTRHTIYNIKWIKYTNLLTMFKYIGPI